MFIKFKSIKTTLLVWFLIIAIVPVLFLAFLSYTNTVSELKKTAENDLIHSSRIYMDFINNWFHYREVDINVWSSDSNTLTFMQELNAQFQSSQISLEKYVKSYAYTKLITSYEADYISLHRQYDYVYDILLFDTKGNLLYTVLKEDDLATNFVTGKYKDTLFSKTYKQSLSDGKLHFSDLERYAPSENDPYGFLTLPIVSKEGEIIGVFALQIKTNDLFSKFKHINLADNGITHFLIGEDDLLRSETPSEQNNILEKPININVSSSLASFTSYDKKEVIGLCHDINILGVQWKLISQIEESILFASTQELLVKTIFFIFSIIIITFFLALIIAKHITQPLRQLAQASLEISQGKRDPIWVKAENEIGILADAFNDMVEDIKTNESILLERSKEREKNLLELKDNEFKLIAAKEEAEAGIKSKAEFLASMSHEIRTPMNGVLGMLGLIKNSKLNDVQTHQVGLAESSAKALLSLINDILDFSKVEAGKMELENLEFNLRDEIGNFAEAIGHRAQENGIELIVDLIKVEYKLVICDPGRLRQILNNLVGNAIKFTQNGEVLITAVLKETSDTQGQLYISIKDTGIGIPKDKIHNLFESFTQVDASTTRKYGGTGLGLSISKKLAYIMGGSVGVTSVEGEGSTFSFNISVGLHKDKHIVIPSVDIKGKRILIIDDNALNREVVSGQFSHWGMNVYEAQDAANALKICKAQERDIPFDIAIVDMQMPDQDGASVGQELKKLYKDMKLVMMTSLGTRGDAQTFKDLGFSAFFPKPCTTQDLFHTLNVLIDSNKAFHESDDFITADNLHAMENDNAWPEKTRILLVEDNMTNQIVANGILETFGLEADTANNGEEALIALKDALQTKAYTLVLMDCQMPILDGYGATEAIRRGLAGKENIKIPIIAMTANAMQGDKEKCLNVGMDDYLSKPVNPQRLQELLKTWLA
ncbi:response regulator [Sulfurimonas sp. MAG313]|nr:response regulator [Sulfurimonas sp. MAG313]MDF1881695.1 response regulator [Sulfurimonas sp. MAG313]